MCEGAVIGGGGRSGGEGPQWCLAACGLQYGSQQATGTAVRLESDPRATELLPAPRPSPQARPPWPMGRLLAAAGRGCGRVRHVPADTCHACPAGRPRQPPRCWLPAVLGRWFP